ncbi:MAG: stage II sporulation protein M [Bacteroidota bacterium]
MREAVFVRRHAPDWESLEALLADGARPDPDALADAYVRLGDDLAYAKTFYPGSATAAYLNDLSALAHSRVYRNRREERGRLVRFWTHEIPLAVYESRRALVASLLLFLGAVGVGVLSSVGDDTFVRLILGDGYVNMTLANIADDDPMRVYKEMQELDMTSYIAFNNLRVSFLTFIGAIPQIGIPAASVGTGWILVSNGIMVGAFAHLFAAEGLIGDWFRVVMIHGTLELSAIVVAGGAGLAMWNALLFPGTYPRLASFRRGAVRGLKILIGLVPVFLAAAALEGFVTRRTEMPLWASLVVILGSLAFVLFYYVALPAHRARAAHD